MDKRLIELKEKSREAFKKNDFLKTSLYIEEILGYSPADVESYFLKANIFHLQGKMGKAISTFKKVIDLDPKHTDAMISLSVLLNDIGKYAEAQTYFEMADSKVKKSDQGIIDNHINRKFSLHHLELAEMYFSYQRFDEALFEYNKAFALDSDNIEVRLKIARVYSKKGYLSKAFEELRSLKSESPNYLPARMALGLLHYSQGNIIEAQSEWQMVLAKDPSYSEAQMYMQLSQSASETNIN